MLVMLMPSLLQRRTLVIQSRFDIDDFLAAIEHYRVTFTGSIGPIAARIIDHPHIDKYDLSSLRSVFALSRADGVEDKILAPCQQMYGITEGMLMASSPNDSGQARHDTMGWPTGRGDEVRLLVPETQDEVLPGETGELCFRSPHMLRAYYNTPDVTRESFTSDGFFRTGDLMRRIEIGGRPYFVFEGRLKDNINRGGEKFGAEEVEFLLARHPAVGDVRIVAMPDTFLGERPCAFVIVKSDQEPPTVAALGEFLQHQGLAKFKLPERVEIVSEFPVTRVGKVDKSALREMIASRLKLEAETRANKVA
jgi:non-ribosomal peptide synthetase component E (peptide arylation enzyme)